MAEKLETVLRRSPRKFTSGPSKVHHKSSQLTEAQRLMFVHLLEKRQEILTSKQHDPRTLVKKTKSWEELTFNFNRLYPDQEPRTVLQLRRAWEYIRKQVKKSHSTYASKLKQTGGGVPPTPPKYTEVNEVTSKIICMGTRCSRTSI